MFQSDDYISLFVAFVDMPVSLGNLFRGPYSVYTIAFICLPFPLISNNMRFCSD